MQEKCIIYFYFIVCTVFLPYLAKVSFQTLIQQTDLVRRDGDLERPIIPFSKAFLQFKVSSR